MTDILTLTEAAEFSKLPRTRLIKLVKERKIEATDLGRGRGCGLRFMRSHLINYMTKQAAKNTIIEPPKGKRKPLIDL